MSAIQPSPPASAFLHPIKVEAADIDFMGHVNNARYLNWVQDAVLAHWRGIAPAEDVASKAWVALKHEITYRKPAFLDDAVIARTVLEQFQGARAFYHTVIHRGEEVLAEVAGLSSGQIGRLFDQGVVSGPKTPGRAVA
jgi:acyl-CoA thioester hydrolase